MWTVTSLRGVVTGFLNVKVLSEAAHSGDSSGIVPSAYRILNMLISRVENPYTGEVAKKFNVTLPPNRYKEVHDLIGILK
jgi:hypothetical protein